MDGALEPAGAEAFSLLSVIYIGLWWLYESRFSRERERELEKPSVLLCLSFTIIQNTHRPF